MIVSVGIFNRDKNEKKTLLNEMKKELLVRLERQIKGTFILLNLKRNLRT